MGGNLTTNYETIGVKFTREEGHNLFVRCIKSPRGVTGHGFKGNWMVKDSWYNICVISNDGYYVLGLLPLG